MYRALWTHGGPTSSFVHIITALCLLVPRLLLEARLIENGNLQRGKRQSYFLSFILRLSLSGDVISLKRISLSVDSKFCAVYINLT